MDKKYISKIYHNGDTLYVKDAEARETMVSSVSYDTTNKKIVETINGVNSDVVSVSTIKSDLNLTKSDVSLSNVTNDAQVKRTEMGVASGVATLDSAGKVPASQLPSYVDDVVEYASHSAFPETGETGKIYVDIAANETYRWSGSQYVIISYSQVQANWNTTDATSKSYIQNKPTNVSSFTNDAGYLTLHQDISGKADKTATVSNIAYDGTNKKITKTINGTTSDVVTVSTIKSDLNLSKSDVGLGNVTNDAQVKRSEMGETNGVATLNSAGKVPTSQLPSYVDDVLEYDTESAFPATGEGGKIYVDKSNNTTWRWSGSAYTQIKGDLTIGTTSGTAADGKVVNDHINNTSNPHGVTKAQVGLDSVVNTGDSATPVSGGTTKFTTGGAYTELNKKVDKVSGKGLSTNDYTTDEKNKLAGIEAGAQTHKAPTATEVKSALGTGSGTTKYLREDGTWQTPPDTNTWPTKTSQLTNDSGFLTGITKAQVTSALGYTPPTSDTNTWRPVSDSVSSTDSSTSASSKAVKTAYDLAASKTSNTGTVTSVAVKMNGSTKGTVTTSGTINLGTVITSHQDISGKQDKLVSGTNIKTINNQSILGSGNITISGGGGSGDYLPLAGGTMTGKITLDIGNLPTGESGPNPVIQSFGGVIFDHWFNLLLGDMAGDWSVFRGSDWNNPLLTVKNTTTGNVGIGTISPSYKLHVNGAVGATQYNNTSDIRKKDIIDNLNLDVEDIANAPIFKFSWIDPEMPEGVNVGTSAQYWQTIIPEIVSETNDDEKTLSMQYGVAGLASSIALARKVVLQENTIEAQETRIKALEDAIANIQNMLNK